MIDHHRPKSPEHIQAQIEAFADKGVSDFSDDQRKILKHTRELTKIEDLDNLPSDVPPKIAKLVESNRQAYIDFLRQESTEEIEFRKENIELYKNTYQPIVQALKMRIDAGNPKDLPEYLGSGSNGDAYRIEVDDKEYAVKFSRNITQANFEIKPLLRAKGIEHTAQLLAYSLADGVVIMELLPGTDVTHFAPEHAPEYTDEAIVQLIETVIELNQNGIVIDPKPSNFLYDEKQGFSVLDYHLKKGDHQLLADSIIDLKLALTARAWPQLDYKADDYEEKAAARSIERSKVYLPMMIRFLTILEEKFPSILEDYKKAYAERETNPLVSQSPLINRASIQIDHPDLVPHLKKLEEMGY